MPTSLARPPALAHPICYRMTPDRCLLDGASAETCITPGTPNGDLPPRVPPCLLGAQHHTTLNFDGIRRVALLVTPDCGGSFRDQAWEAVSTVRAILRQQGEPMALTVQTVFLADPADAPVARQIFEASYGDAMPLTLFVAQPPCGDARIAIEAWAIGTRRAQVEYRGPHLVTVEHDGLRWIHASAAVTPAQSTTAYADACAVFAGLERALGSAGATFADVARVWLYQGGITDRENGVERYGELNRARTNFFQSAGLPGARWTGSQGYPASTGIGTRQPGIGATCLAVQSDRGDVRGLSLENPWQTPACDYPPAYSAQSPKFARATALRVGRHQTFWVSGTASIVNAETCHAGDIVRQTEQTLDHIEHLIGPANVTRHGWPDGGATLRDLAKIRVYVKHPRDVAACRAVLHRRLGPLPAVFAQADVCREDLLVEIEGVAFAEVRSGG